MGKEARLDVLCCTPAHTTHLFELCDDIGRKIAVRRNVVIINKPQDVLLLLRCGVRHGGQQQKEC